VGRFLPLLLLLALGGCGGAPEREEPVKNSAPPAQTDTRPAIVAFGDSLTEGFGVDPSRSYPAVLQNELDRRGLAYRVVNLGASGETSTDGAARVSGVIAFQPAMVVLEFGANDGLRGIPVAVTRANLARMIEELKKARIPVVLAGMTLPPNYGPEYINGFEAMYKDLAAKYDVPLIPFLLAGVGGDGRYMQPDGLHPNAAGYARVAGNVMRTIEPLLDGQERLPRGR
jgi:acyl-CoA thioesterase-1